MTKRVVSIASFVQYDFSYLGPSPSIGYVAYGGKVNGDNLKAATRYFSMETTKIKCIVRLAHDIGAYSLLDICFEAVYQIEGKMKDLLAKTVAAAKLSLDL